MGSPVCIEIHKLLVVHSCFLSKALPSRWHSLHLVRSRFTWCLNLSFYHPVVSVSCLFLWRATSPPPQAFFYTLVQVELWKYLFWKKSYISFIVMGLILLVDSSLSQAGGTLESCLHSCLKWALVHRVKYWAGSGHSFTSPHYCRWRTCPSKQCHKLEKSLVSTFEYVNSCGSRSKTNWITQNDTFISILYC